MGKPLLFISDGTVGGEINLLDPKAIMVNGWKPKMPQLKGGGIYSNSALADGHELVVESYDDVVEEMPLFINGKDPDQIGAAEHNLFDLTRKLRDYFINRNRNATPVYLGFRPKDQTNIQYALLKNYGLDTTTEGFGHEIKGSLFKPAVMAGTLNLEREHGWRDNPPGILPNPLTINQPQAPAQSTIQAVSNHRNSFSLTHIYNYDDSLVSFSANLVASAVFNYFPAAPAAQDIVYFGSTEGPFFNISINIGTGGDYVASFTWEYWNGAAWTNANTLVDSGCIGTSGAYAIITGLRPVRFFGAVGWSKTVINGVNAYWLRCRISAFTSWTTSPANVSFAPFAVRDPYIELDSNDVVGDIAALLQFSFFSATQGTNNYCNRVIVGSKSRGLSGFNSRINCTTFDNPVGTIINYGADTTVVQDYTAANGNRAVVSFAGTTAMASRVYIFLPNGSSYVGIYEVYVIAQQIGGSAGDVSIRLSPDPVSFVYSSPVKLTRVGNGREIINMGRMSIPVAGFGNVGTLTFDLQASAVSSIPDLYLYEIVLMPIDEGAIAISDPVLWTTAAGSAFKLLDRMVVDGGLVRESASIDRANAPFSGDITAIDYAYTSLYEMRGDPPRVMPSRTTRFYFLFCSLPSGSLSGTMIDNKGMGALIQMRIHQRWLGFRGDE